MRHQISSREKPRDMIGFVIGSGISGAKPDALCGSGHHHHNSQRIKLHRAHAMRHGIAEIIRIDVGHREPIIKEGHVEFAIFQNARDALVVIRRQKIAHGSGVTPGTR